MRAPGMEQMRVPRRGKSEHAGGSKCERLGGSKSEHLGGSQCEHLGWGKSEHLGGSECERLGAAEANNWGQMLGPRGGKIAHRLPPPHSNSPSLKITSQKEGEGGKASSMNT